MRTSHVRPLMLVLTLLCMLATPAAAQSSTAGRGSATDDGSVVVNQHSLEALAGKVRANFARDSDDTVIAPGTPPLTMASLRAFAELMRLTFDVQMTAAEFDITRQQFVRYYSAGDAQTKQMLALGWQSILARIESCSGTEREKQLEEVRAVFADRFEKGARAGAPWYVTMWATIQRRLNTVAEIETPMPADALRAGLNRSMSEADLDAAVEMLYFMWVACGRDASVVTPDVVAHVRVSIVQTFPTFSPEVQTVFANAQQFYAALRAQWAQADAGQRSQMAAGFAQALDALGLTEGGSASGGGEGGAWADVSSQSHGEWAASMVQGLAGSSYKSSW